jgi:hypothetical protein|tara:strand:+ start:4969 stop:5715 length:747 start_codon:yes stop_codon:yes gene_type:complete
MDILISFDDTKKFCMLISAVIKPLRVRLPSASIEVISGCDLCRKLLSYIPGITDVTGQVSLSEYDKFYCFDDRISNLVKYKNIKCKEYVGYKMENNTIEFHKDELSSFFNCYCLKFDCSENILDSFFNIFGLNWNREGFNINYKPRSRSSNSRDGIAISNGNLRSFVKSNLFNNGEKLWHIPIRQDPLKCIDEVNKCSNIVTDNIFYAFLGSFLRKKVIFLVEDGCSFNPNIFDDTVIQNVSSQVLYD